MGYLITRKRELGQSGTLYEMELRTPLIAAKAHAGNFILIRINETGERIPLTVADYDREKGTITIVFQVVGKTTKLLSMTIFVGMHSVPNPIVLIQICGLSKEISWTTPSSKLRWAGHKS